MLFLRFSWGRGYDFIFFPSRLELPCLFNLIIGIFISFTGFSQWVISQNSTLPSGNRSQVLKFPFWSLCLPSHPCLSPGYTSYAPALIPLPPLPSLPHLLGSYTLGSPFQADPHQCPLEAGLQQWSFCTCPSKHLPTETNTIIFPALLLGWWM